jgi:DNA-binding NarL/FixJ family response regulator
VDDHPVVREGLAAHISAEGGLEVCGQAEDMADALDQIRTTHPDVAVVDISLKTSNGLELIKRLAARDRPVRIIVWSMHPETLYAERALRAGAMGYLHKGSATAEIIKAIRTVLAGQIYLSPGLSARLLGRLVGVVAERAAQDPVETLSDRELEVFRLIGRGMTTDQVAEQMIVSPKTVETYRGRIKEKLGVVTYTELVQRAAVWVSANG